MCLFRKGSSFYRRTRRNAPGALSPPKKKLRRVGGRGTLERRDSQAGRMVSSLQKSPGSGAVVADRRGGEGAPGTSGCVVPSNLCGFPPPLSPDRSAQSRAFLIDPAIKCGPERERGAEATRHVSVIRTRTPFPAKGHFPIQGVYLPARRTLPHTTCLSSLLPLRMALPHTGGWSLTDRFARSWSSLLRFCVGFLLETCDKTQTKPQV